MGKVIRLSATEARNNFFSLLNRVLYTDVTVIVDKADAPSEVEIRRVKKRERVKEALKALEESYGMWKDLPDSYFKKINRFMRGKKEKDYMEKLTGGIIE